MNKLPSYPQASQQLTPIEKAGQLFMPAAFINATEKEIVRLEKTIQEHYIGGLCFFHSRTSAATNFEGKKVITHNAESFETLKELIERYQSVAKYPLLISIDAEWGLAMRIENTPQYPYAITLGAIQDTSDLIYEVGKNIAKDCKTAGIHWNLAPVVDINNNPENPVIGYRSFGEDRTAVANKALAYIQGAKSEGVLTSIKHFPGHGDTATDSHLGLPLIDKSKEELVQNELHPFQKLIDEGVDSVMVGHLSVPALANGKTVSSSISKEVIKGVLRKEMGFEGVVISDALNMHAVSKNHPIKGELEWLAFDAGNDVLCFAEHTKEGIEAILKNASEEQIEESFERVWKLKEKAMNNVEKGAMELSDADELNQKIASASLTLLKGNDLDIAAFRKTNYCTLTLKRFDQNQDKSEIKKGLELTKSEVENEKNILLLMTPPQVKPTGDFGFLKDEIDFINELVQTKNVVLYLFGNPFMMNHINFERTTATVVVYQNFKVFQDIATEHFLGNISAKGKLPVRIKPWEKIKNNR